MSLAAAPPASIASAAPVRPLRAMRRPTNRALPALVGAIATASSALLSWVPSFWGDEAASIMSAQRPVSSLLGMLGNVDAVHGAYYLFLHFWIRIFGISELAVRAPSAIAVGVTAAGVVVLVRQFADRTTAVLAGLACAVLPRFTLMGAEARSYAISAAIAVWATVVVTRFLRDRTTRWMSWAAYSALLAVGMYVFLYLGLLAIAHGVFLAIVRTGRRVRGRWLVATGAAVLLAAPVIVAGVSERAQIAFLARRHVVTLQHVLVTQWFGTTALATVCWVLIAVAVVAGVRRRHAASAQLTLLAALWLLAPTVLLLGGNALITPMYQVRYLSFAAPAAAILVALGIRAIAPRRIQLVAGLVVVALAVPSWVAQRTAFAKDGGSDWRGTSEVLAARAKPGDGIYFDPSTKPSRRPRLAMHVYPGAYAGLVDVALKTPFDEHPGLWDIALPLTDARTAIEGVNRVWVVNLSRSSADSSGDETALLRADGLHLVDTIHLHRSTVYEYSR